MSTTSFLPCDGCGQPGSADHFARRLQRLELSTRYRPVHVQTLLLGAFPPAADSSFLYSEVLPPDGEAARLLDVLQIPWEGKPPASFLGEFQKRGLFLMHLLECSVEEGSLTEGELQGRLEAHLPWAAARIRRSLKPKRVVLVSPELRGVAAKLTESSLGSPVLLHMDKPFEIMRDDGSEIAAFRVALEGAGTGGGSL
ncbi:MAG TPA: hypothetical protein VGF61_14100 [Candidatus Acidoferrum sp.]|jgi:hypothetical protein